MTGRGVTGRGAPRIVGRRNVFEGWNRLDVVTVDAGDGAVCEREVIHHGDAAVVLTVDRERRIAILVRQWRAPLIGSEDGDDLLEACAGIIDPGETPEEAARREAAEEIGYRLGALRRIATVFPCAGTLTERMHLFIADVTVADRVADGGGRADEGEAIEVVEMALAELFTLARDGKIADAKTLILIQRLMLEQDPFARDS